MSDLKTSVLETLKATATNVVEDKVEAVKEQVVSSKEELIVDLKKQLKAEIYKEVKTRMEKATPKEKKSHNLFFCPTLIGIVYALYVSVQPNLEEAIKTKEFTTSFWFDTFSKLLAAAATLTLRGSEGAKGVHTFKGMIGLDKEDFNNNGIPDYLES